MKISLLVPTRGRSEIMRRMWESALQAAYTPESLEVCFFIDNDDHQSLDAYEKIASPQTKLVSGDREATTLSEKWNEAYKVATGEIFHLCNDDLIFRSIYWDKILILKFEEIPDRIAYVYGSDGVYNEKLGTLGFLHKNWVEAVGYFVPPYFKVGYNDAWLNEVANRINRAVYEPAIYTEHMHYVWGKAEKDQTYKDNLKESGASKQLWKDTKSERIADASKLLAFIKEFEAKSG